MTMLRKVWVPLAVAMLAVPGCGGDEEQAGELAEVPARSAYPAPTDASLDDVNRSGIRGTTRLTRGEGGIDVELRLEGAEPGTKYIARLHRGQCGERGAEVVQLGHIGVTETEALLTERIDPTLMEPGQPYSVEVRTGDRTPVACADLDLSTLDLSAPRGGTITRTAQPEPAGPVERAGEGGGQAASEAAAAANP